MPHAIAALDEMRAQGTVFALAHVHPPTLALWRRAGQMEVIDERNVYATVREAEEALTASGCQRPPTASWSR